MRVVSHFRPCSIFWLSKKTCCFPHNQQMTSQKRKESSPDSPEDADSDSKQDAQCMRKKAVKKARLKPLGRAFVFREADLTF